MRPRLAGPEAAEAAAGLFRASLSEGWTREGVEAVLAQRSGLLLVLDAPEGGLVGALLLRVEAGEAEVLQVAVSGAHRRRGLGARLLRAGEAAAIRHGAERCFLEVREGNSAARRLYEGSGYREVGRRAGYYRDGEDALVLARAFDPGPPVSG